jgi:hypothetical protein
MSGHLLLGARTWSGERDENGYRNYHATFRVRMDSTLDGPALALQTPGIPIPGSQWIIDNDVDQWAFCKQNVSVKPVLTDGDPNSYFDLEFLFSTKADNKRCKDQQVDDPLLEPQKVSGGFTKYQEEATIDRFGQPIVNSAWEQMRGPQVEFDGTRYHVAIEQNVPQLQFALVDSMKDTLNQYLLWGFPSRTLKLTGFTWEKKFHFQCNVYYMRKFEFEGRLEGWDRNLLDEGTKVLHGRWDTVSGNWLILDVGGSPPNNQNPQHFDRFKDRNGENTRVILNGFGLPSGVSFGTGTFHGTFVCTGLNVRGIPPTNVSSWIPCDGFAPALWLDSINYVTGEAVNVPDDEGTFSTYVALRNNFGHNPEAGGNDWQLVITGLPSVGTNPFIARGLWSTSTTYNVSGATLDVVTYSTVTSKYGPGTIHVEKYNESDFLQLGIPTSIE